MAFLLRHCDGCGQDKAKAAFYDTKSPFHPEGVLNLCKDCVCKMLEEHPDDLAFADKLCQWADIPFNPEQWIKFYETNKEFTFDIYHTFYMEDSRIEVAWTDLNTKWLELQRRGELEDSIDIFSNEKLRQLKTKWGENYDETELNYLEQLLVGMLQTQNINGKLQMDQALKLCKISLIIDDKIRANENFKDELANYDKLVKVADFTPKNVKNANDFDSAGEIFAYLEKLGWVNNYYDDVERDIVDKSMKNIQAWLRHLYVNETGIAEDIARRIEGLKLAKQLEDQVDSNMDNELDKVDSEAYQFEEEEFEVEI